MTPVSPHPKRWWIRGRRLFRWCRIAGLSLVLVVLSAATYLNQIGLPGFLKRPLVARLHEHGLDLQFSRVRLRWDRGMVAERIQLGGTTSPSGPRLFIDEAQLHLNHTALKRLRLEIDALRIRQGTLVWPLPAEANQAGETVKLEGIMAEIRFRPGDQWELADLTGRCLGAQVSVGGILNQASALRHWQWRPATNQTSLAWARSLHEIIHTVQQTRFPTPPRLLLSFSGNAADPASLRLHVELQCARAIGAGWRADTLMFTARAGRATGSNDFFQTDLSLRANALRLPSLRLDRSLMSGRVLFTSSNTLPVELSWRGQSDTVSNTWLRGQKVECSGTSLAVSNSQAFRTQLLLSAEQWQSHGAQTHRGQLRATLTYPWAALGLPLNEATGSPSAAPAGAAISFAGDGEVELAALQSKWGEAGKLRLGLRAHPLSQTAAAPADASWAYWARLAPLAIDWELALDNGRSDQLRVNSLSAAGQWLAPRLSLSRLETKLYRGQLGATGQLDVASRQLRGQADFDLDLHRLASLLDTNTQHFLAQFTWATPPSVKAQAQLQWPAWTKQRLTWHEDFLPALKLDGAIRSGPAAFRGVPLASAQLEFGLSNRVWRIPDLLIQRPEGQLALTYAADLVTRDYAWNLRGRIDPKSLQPLLPPAQRRALALFEFTAPPLIQGQVWGHWDAPERVGLALHVAATNLTFRGESCTAFAADLSFTNQYLHATNIRLERGSELVTTPGVGFDLAAQRVFLTNIVARIDPRAVARAIGPKTAKTLEPYHFAQPPDARINGSLDVPDADQARLEFVLSGGPFHYWKFTLPQVNGTVRWTNDTLLITNFAGQFYGGQATGHLAGDLGPKAGAVLQFQAAVTNTDLHLLLQDLYATTNRLEGLLAGQLNIGRLNAKDWQSWQGLGNVELRQGLIWDIPLFGYVSQMLNAVVPGVGNSRATEATASFTIRNSVIYTKDLQVRAPGVRLNYDGSVDFAGQLNARVQASLLRGVPLVGPLVSLALTPVTKLFEYKITGTLTHPKSEPIFMLPKVLLVPLHPFRTLKEIFSTPPPANLPPPVPPKAVKP